MGTVGKVGGILALVGGTLVLIESLAIFLGMPLFGGEMEVFWTNGAILYPLWPILSPLLGAVAIVGGVLALAGRKLGGLLVLITVILWITYPLLYELAIFIPELIVLTPMGLLDAWLNYQIWIFSFDVIIVMVGGILGLGASRNKI